ncbi:unnamed protein product [Macrosiphum euphorbiae]|uniref:Uncharacterized protein n=1 Tax=Macrosiphum euphorbiae TaxID=13131 RepID=A0AAV0WCT8_9HEMI|nr:unnamed protein product [Macrosiphum euphorbiae]
MLRTSTSPPSLQKALRSGSDFEFDSGDKSGYSTYVLQACLCEIIILLYFSTLFSRHPANTTRTTHQPLDNPPKGKDLEIRIYTCIPQTRYPVIGIQILQVRPLAPPPGDWKCTFSRHS